MASREIDLKGTAESCYSMANPNWLANQQQAALDPCRQAAPAPPAAAPAVVAATTLGPAAARAVGRPLPTPLRR